MGGRAKNRRHFTGEHVRAPKSLFVPPSQGTRQSSQDHSKHNDFLKHCQKVIFKKFLLNGCHLPNTQQNAQKVEAVAFQKFTQGGPEQMKLCYW